LLASGPTHKSAGTAKYVRCHGDDIDTDRQGEVMWSVSGCDRIRVNRVGTHPSGYRFLPSGQVHFTWDESCTDIEDGLLVSVVFAQDRFLVGADQHHLTEQLTRSSRFHVSSSV